MSTTVLPRPGDRAQPPSPFAARRRVPGRVRAWVLGHDGYWATLVYAALALLWYRGVIAHMSSNCACGTAADVGDNAQYVWWFQWFVHALGHGLPVLHPAAIWAPTGINLAGTTASLTLAALAAPVTVLWGPIAAYNVVMILAPVTSALAANRLCRHLSGATVPALLGGATYGFSTYEIGQLVGHAHVAWMFCPPLVALLVLRLFNGTLSRRAYVARMSLLLLLQLFLSVEVMFTMTLVGLIVLAAVWVTGDATQRRALVRRLPLLAAPYALAIMLSSWYLIQVLAGTSFAKGVGARYPTDLLSFFVPMPYTWLGGGQFTSLSTSFPGGQTETTAYLGLPLLLVVGRFLYTRRRTQTARVLAATMAATVLWMLGPTLWIAGRPVVRLPYAAISGLPIFDDVMQGRTAIYLALLASVALAIWLAEPQRHTRLRWLFGLIAVTAVLPNLASPSTNNVSAWTNPAFFRTGTYRRYIHRGQSVLPIPWGYKSASYVWQAEDHMSWNLASGYWSFWPPRGWQSRITVDLWLNQPQHGDAPLLRDLLIKRDISDVVVQLGHVARWSAVLRGAGLRPTVRSGGVSVYKVPRSWLTDER